MIPTTLFFSRLGVCIVCVGCCLLLSVGHLYMHAREEKETNNKGT